VSLLRHAATRTRTGERLTRSRSPS
jgi:hypothetical protein